MDSSQATDSTEDEPLIPGHASATYTWVRWLRLALIAFGCMYAQMLWEPYDTIPLSVMAVFGWDKTWVMVLSSNYYIQFLLVPFSGVILYKLGIRVTLVISYAAIFLAFLVRSFDTSQTAYTVLSNIGVMLVAVGTLPFFGIIQHAIGVEYFKPGIERSVVITVTVISVAFGNACGSTFYPHLVDEPILSKNGTVSNLAEMRTQFFHAMWIISGLAILLLILSAILYGPAPRILLPLPVKDLLHQTKHLATRKDFWLLATCYGWMATLFYSQYQVAIGLIGVTILDMTQQQIGISSAIAVIAATLVGVGLAALMDKCRWRYRKLPVLSVIACGLCGGVWFVLMCLDIAGKGFALVGTSITIMVTGHSAPLGLILSRLCHLCHPIPTEATTTGAAVLFFLINPLPVYVQSAETVPYMFSVYMVGLGGVLSFILVLLSGF